MRPGRDRHHDGNSPFAHRSRRTGRRCAAGMLLASRRGGRAGAGVGEAEAATTTDPSPFGTLLRRHRLAAGLTQEELAERAGVSARAVSDLERGGGRRPRLATVALLAAALDLGPAPRAALLAAARPGADAASGPSMRAPAGAPTGSLPVYLTSFVGREQEDEEVRRLLGRARLVTLTGAGGVGKTRLALHVAAGLRGAYPDGVWLADLAPLASPADPSLVAQAVLVALGARGAPGQTGPDALADHLRARRALLVLDNCEHLTEGCARLLDALLRACPELAVLATSREPLRVAGEVSWSVPALPVPPAAASAGVLAYPSARLFAERAAAAAPGFVVDDASADAVARLCRGLDGLPLAIELAAVRVRALTPEQIADRLEDRFRLLTAGERAAPPRHRTLAASLDWSHDLLAEPERALFRRLAVFAGGFDLGAAEAVCAGAGLSAEEVPGLLAGLVDRSLVVAGGAAGDPPPTAPARGGGGFRYRLLETVRAYALERLERSGEADAARGGHGAYLLELAGRGALAAESGWTAWLGCMERERDNLPAALDLAVGRFGGDDPAAAERGLRLAVALAPFWSARGPVAEGRGWLTALLVRSERTADAVLRARALAALGELSAAQ